MPTEEELRAHYSGQDTEELIELRARQTLVPEAYRVLDEILRERGVDPTAAAIQGEERDPAKARTDAVAAALPHIEWCWKRTYAAFVAAVSGLLLLIVNAFVTNLQAWYAQSMIPAVIGLVAIALMLGGKLAFYVSLATLARALGKSSIGWVLVALFVPYVGGIVALGTMHSYVSQAREVSKQAGAQG